MTRSRALPKPVELPAGCHCRRPQPGDVAAIVDLMNAVDMADVGITDNSAEDVHETWALPRFNIERDAWVIVGPDRRIVAYGWMWDRKPHVEIQADSYIAPDMASSGLEEALLERIEVRAEEHRAGAPKSEEVLIRIFTSPHAAPRVAALTLRGYVHVRTFCRMKIEMSAPPPDPTWPYGIEARPYVRGRDDKAADLAIQESFSEHFGYVPEPHHEWVERRTGQPGFDPELCTLAWDGSDIAGAVLAYAPDTPEKDGWVRELGVRTAWRGRGLGRALLLHTFGHFARRGIMRVALGVDTANDTGATQLYESVGMSVAFRHDLYEKRLGPGRAA